MDENKKKSDEEKPEAEAPKPEEKADDKPKDEPPKADEPKEEPKPEKAEEKPAEEKTAEENAPAEEKPTEEPAAEIKDEKDEKILRLETQIAAMKLGVSGDCMEDAVAIAESYVKSGKSADINSALSAVIKKYPDMKADGKESKKGGFKVGADSSPKSEGKSDDRVSSAFGIKKKK